jgi:hypothetical protein
VNEPAASTRPRRRSPSTHTGQLRVGQVVGAVELLRPHSEGQRHEDVGDEGRIVAVPAVLSQQRRRVPEPGYRLLGYVERPQPCRVPKLGYHR